jgi:hypothetical protein
MLPQDKVKFLQFVFTSSAVRKFEENQKQDLTFADACRFWDITQNLKGEAVDNRLQYVEQMLNVLNVLIGREDAELPSGRVVTSSDIRALRNLHHYLEDRFERVLHLLRSRASHLYTFSQETTSEKRQHYLQSLTSKERQQILNTLSAEERRQFLQSLSVDERLHGLSIEEIRAYLARQEPGNDK